MLYSAMELFSMRYL